MATENKPYPKKRKSRFTDEQVMRALTKGNGIQSEAARILQIERATLCERIKASPNLQAHLKQMIEDRIDRAERALDALLADDNTTAVIFTLKTIGRSRGYIEHAPTEEIDTAKLAALSQFFSSVNSKPAPVCDQQSSKPPESRSSVQADLGSCKAKTLPLETNFP